MITMSGHQPELSQPSIIPPKSSNVSESDPDEEPLAMTSSQDHQQTLKMQFDELSSYLSSYLTRSSMIPGTVAVHQRITNATPEQLYELSTDIYDELSRRKSNEAPCLPIRRDLHQRRNASRQKLATIPNPRFEHLSGDVYMEVARRYPQFYGCINDDSDWSLALSCWILRQHGYRGLRRTRRLNKGRGAGSCGHASRNVRIEEIPAGGDEKRRRDKEEHPPAYSEASTPFSSPRLALGSELTLVTSVRPLKGTTAHPKDSCGFAGLRKRCKAWFSSLYKKSTAPAGRNHPPPVSRSEIEHNRASTEEKHRTIGRLKYTFKSLLCLARIRLGS